MLAVVTCPCALSLATPAALAAANRAPGAQWTAGNARSRPSSSSIADHIVFDKTGTLTRGQPRFEQVRVLDRRISREQCLAIAAALEPHSAHPLARAFASINAAADVTELHTAAGRGLEGQVGSVQYRLGRPDYVLEGLAPSQRGLQTGCQQSLSIVALGTRTEVLALFSLADELRADVRAAVLARLH